MKWDPFSSQGVVAAGGKGEGNSMYNLNVPIAVAVDQMGTVYVLEHNNHRVTRWFKGAQVASVIAGGNGFGNGAHQLQFPHYLTFDRHGNLYVADTFNHRIQKFAIDKRLCNSP
ncbi:unnamed protein product [Rotaria sp. Silwood2]|nr:unnamed protein product [Rotaria sp. Silwood2]CAF2639261.1 unnamed protein product [Rotaria sp. Silwood2]CAF2972522.1 unnamed protein product [Rotaria sp. Silwood2]CAF3075252.1 unnamed protein product [Rotaria sp. Silwood2]CAF3914311.1 unnamed protein product [Rotaria sp. Silwood2]